MCVGDGWVVVEGSWGRSFAIEGAFVGVGEGLVILVCSAASALISLTPIGSLFEEEPCCLAALPSRLAAKVWGSPFMKTMNLQERNQQFCMGKFFSSSKNLTNPTKNTQKTQKRGVSLLPTKKATHLGQNRKNYSGRREQKSKTRAILYGRVKFGGEKKLGGKGKRTTQAITKKNKNKKKGRRSAISKKGLYFGSHKKPRNLVCT